MEQRQQKQNRYFLGRFRTAELGTKNRSYRETNFAGFKILIIRAVQQRRMKETKYFPH